MVTDMTPTVEQAMAAIGKWAQELQATTRILQAEVDARRRLIREVDSDGPSDD